MIAPPWWHNVNSSLFLYLTAQFLIIVLYKQMYKQTKSVL
jgi:hypothetical protein